MNTTHSPDSSSGEPDDAGTDSTGSAESPGAPGYWQSQRPVDGFFGWLRDLGFVRSGDRWFAGVASGIAAKIAIDPLIVRGIFVVLAILGGPGIVLYLIGWLLMPDHTGRIHLEDIFRGRASTGVLITAIVLAAVVVLPVIIRMLGVPWGGFLFWNLWGTPDWVSVLLSVFWWIAVIGAGVWLVVWLVARDRSSDDASGSQGPHPAGPTGPAQASGQAGAASRADSMAGAPEPAGSPHSSFATDSAGTTIPDSTAGTSTAQGGTAAGRGAGGEDFGARADAWSGRAEERAADWSDRTGKKATEWSERVAAEHEARKLGAGHVLLTLALALLTGGVTAVAVLTSGATLPAAGDLAHLALVSGTIAALTIVGLSLIIAGVRGRDGGWVAFFSWVGIIALLFTAIFPAGSVFHPFGNHSVRLADEPNDQTGVAMIAGSTRVDLTPLDRSDRGIDDFEVWVFAGNTRLALPEERPAIVDVRVLAGNINAIGVGPDDQRSSGPLLSRTYSANLENTDGGTSGGAGEDGVVHVTVYLGFGNVRLDGSGTGALDSDHGPATGHSDRPGRSDALDDLVDERDELTTELDRVEWELSEPGLSSREGDDLDDRRQQIVDDINRVENRIDRLEAEMAR